MYKPKQKNMNKKKAMYWLGLVIAILTAIISYCSCSVTTDFSKEKSGSPTSVTNSTNLQVDSIKI